MRIIDIDPIPNQEFSVTVDGNRWDFVIKEAVSSMICDLSLNDEVILSGARIVAGTPIIPYEYMRRQGNFIILTENEEIPYWTQFGVSQQLIYASVAELDDIPSADLEWSSTISYANNVVIINSLSIVLIG
jgi:hypothetical protein